MPVPDQIPNELSGDAVRQAVGSQAGYVYQAWCSIDAWLQLESEDEVIYLEGAEDFDRVSASGATAGQARRVVESISLNTAKAREALENFWQLRQREPARTISYHYLTTASPALEQDAAFGGLKGIEAWHAAKTDIGQAEVVRSYLQGKLTEGTPLHAFVSTVTAEDFQAQVVQRFHWLVDQPGIDEMKRSVNDRLTHRLSARSIPLSHLDRVRNKLESEYWNTVVKPASLDRRLTAADLIRLVEGASTELVPVSAPQLQQLLRALPTLLNQVSPGRALIDVTRLPIPGIPSPLLARDHLVELVKRHLRGNLTVALTGSVYKGKTTLAQVVAMSVFPQAWWFSLAGRTSVDADNLFRALAEAIQTGDSPDLAVVDDLDLAPGEHAVYRHSLALAVRRASAAGRGLLLTARGAPSDLLMLSDFVGIEVVDVPEMAAEEIQLHCVTQGCNPSDAQAWSILIFGATGGHPKLVQVRITELAARGWPSASPTDFVTASPAVDSARHSARRLLSGAVTPPVAEYIYTAAEATSPLSRAMLLHLGQSIPGLVNAGDVIDELCGKWLEPVGNDRFRITPMLKGAAAEVWISARRAEAHCRLHDAIASARHLTPPDAAAMLFHAFLAQDPARLIVSSRMLQGIEEREASRQTFNYLVWFPFVALTPATRFVDANPVTNLFLRQLQFDVAKELDTDTIPALLDRWSEEISEISIPELKSHGLSYQRLALIGTMSEKVPLRRKLDAITGFSLETGTFAAINIAGAKAAIALSVQSPGGIPANATPVEFFILMRASEVKSVAALAELLDWLTNGATDEIRRAFDSVLTWPAVQGAAGCFVHSVWTPGFESRTDWSPILTAFRYAHQVAQRFQLRNYGREVAKAESIVIGESLHDHAGALRVLDEAVQAYGDSHVLQEQRANALFQAGDNAGMLEVWQGLMSSFPALDILDPFAFRRAGISAGRLQRWEEAERQFILGSKCARSMQLSTTKVGLLADASYVAAQGGALSRAASHLADAMLELPPEAFEDGHADWEMLLRGVSEYHRYIDAKAFFGGQPEARVRLGFASEPGNVVPETTPNQGARTQLMVAYTAELSAELGNSPSTWPDKLHGLTRAKFPMVRMVACSGLLALEFLQRPGPTFIDTLSAYERAFAVFASLSDSHQGLADDSGTQHAVTVRTIPIAWFPVLVAAAVSCEDVVGALNVWEGAAQRTWSDHAELRLQIHEMAIGYSHSASEALAVAGDTRAERGRRCGAAMRVLAEPAAYSTALTMQGLLLSAMESNHQVKLVKNSFEGAVARRFAQVWARLLENPFSLKSPRTGAALLRDVLADVGEARAGARLLLDVVGRILA